MQLHYIMVHYEEESYKVDVFESMLFRRGKKLIVIKAIIDNHLAIKAILAIKKSAFSPLSWYVYCCIFDGKWTIKYSLIIIIVVITWEFRQHWKFDMAHIQMAKFLLSKFHRTSGSSINQLIHTHRSSQTELVNVDTN